MSTSTTCPGGTDAVCPFPVTTTGTVLVCPSTVSVTVHFAGALI